MANNKEIIPVLDFNSQAIWRCGECGNELFAVSYTQADEDMKNHIQFCSHCGKKINWFRNLKGETTMSKANEQLTWTFLMTKISNPYGVAGLMGNLYAESGINPKNLQNSGNKKLGLTDDEYTNRVQAKIISKKEFSKDGFGYGIAQWTYHTRKEKMYDFCMAGGSIGDLLTQLDFLWKELQGYKTVLKTLKNAKTIREASDIVLLKYERPADQSEKTQKKRSEYGRMMFEKYSPTAKKKYVKINAKSVNIRLKPGKSGKAIEIGVKGDLFEFVGQDTETGWYQIIARNGEKAWVTNKNTYTSIVEE